MRAKPAGKGLSALVRGLREMEEERLDDEMDLLREMEMEIDNPQRSEPKEAKVFVFDSQVPDMPLGADGENESESEVDEDALNKKSQGRDSRPFKTWKKKGQKRTTRRVCLKPSTAKWKPEPKWNGGKEVESDQESAEAIAETQEQPPPPPPLQPSSSTLRPQTPIIITSNNTLDDSSPNSDSGSDFAQDHALHPPTKAGKTPTSRTRLEAANAPNKHDSAIGEDAKANGGESSKVGRKRKKVAATAHANFRALKIRGFAGGKSGMRRGRGGRFAAGRR